jgi:hypothetical protein
MDIMRELTDTELESVAGGQAAAAASAGFDTAAAGAVFGPAMFTAISFSGANVAATAGIAGAAAGAAAD